MTAIIDYGVGNLFSLALSLRFIGAECAVTRDADEVRRADRIILPGVGAFGDAAEKLAATGLVPVLKERAAAGVPLLGICLGMQLLFEKSYEYGEHEGLGFIRGSVCPDMDVCPKCGSSDLTKIDRMNGYLSYSRVHGDTMLSSAKMAEISERKSM